MRPDVSVLVVNYNGGALLGACLRSITAHADVPLEVVVVDNGSSDGSEQQAEELPFVRLVRNDRNAGFGGGNNLAARHATGRYFLLLNADAELQSGLRDAVARMDADEKLGALGGRLHYPDGRPQPSAGYAHGPLRLVLSWTGLPGAGPLFRRVYTEAAFYERPRRPIAWASGALLLVRADAWETVGGFDEGFFMYVEDVDLGRRLRAAGFELAYVPELAALHHEGGGGAWVGPRAVAWTADSYAHLLAQTARPAMRRATLVALGAVWGARALALGAARVLTGQKRYGEQARAFAGGAARLWSPRPSRPPHRLPDLPAATPQ